MRFSLAAVLAVAGLATAARSPDIPPTDGFAAISKPTKDQKVPAGESLDIKWEPTAEKYPGTVTITLIGGKDPGHLNILDDIADGVDIADGSYSWDVPSDLGELATYGIEISWDGKENREVFQWSNPFQIVGGDDDDKPGNSTSTTPRPTITPTPSGNLSTTTRPTQTTVVTETSGTRSPSSTSPAPTTPTSGAGLLSGSTFALFGGFAMAFFAL